MDNQIYLHTDTLREFFTLSPDLFCIIKLDGSIVELHESWTRVLGYPREELMSRPFQTLIHPDDLAKTMEIFVGQFNGKDVLNFINRYISKAGDHVWLEWHAMASQDMQTVHGVARDITEQKRLEEALKESEKINRLMNQLNDDLVIRFDRQYRHLYVNPASVKYFNIQPSEFLGKTHEELGFPLEACDYWHSEIEKVFVSGKPAKIITPLERGKKWVDWQLIPELDEGGNVVSVLSYTRDVTDLKNTEEEARQNKEKFQALVDNMGDGILLVNSNSEIVLANPASEKLFNTVPGALCGRSMLEFFQKEDVDKVWSDANTFTSGKARNYILEINYLKGDKITIHATVTPFFDKDQTLCTLGILQDITEEEHLRKELTLKEQKFRTLIENVDVSVMRFDREFRHTYVNKAMAEQLGLRVEDFIGKSHAEMGYQREFSEYIEHRLSKVFESGKVLKELSEYEIGGKRHYYDWSVIPEFDVNGLVASVLSVTRDITEHIEMRNNLEINRNKLEKTIAMKDKFFSVIAHDLRGPLNSFLQLTDMLETGFDEFSKDEIKEDIKLLKSSAGNIIQLLENLLEWARLQRGLTKADKTAFPLSEIYDSIALYAESAAVKQITLEVDIPTDISVYADVRMVNGIIRNLVSNALKYTHKGGTISVKGTKAPGGSAEISVTDTGIGMDEKVLQSLFQIGNIRNRKGTQGEESSGLGLLLVKDFIEMNGGSLRIESTVGSGSVFTFDLPLG